jgi:hypothetical protein
MSPKRICIPLIAFLYLVVALLLRPSTSRSAGVVFDYLAIAGGIAIMALLASCYFSTWMHFACGIVIGILFFPGLITRMNHVVLPCVMWTVYASAVCLLGRFVNSETNKGNRKKNKGARNRNE